MEHAVAEVQDSEPVVLMESQKDSLSTAAIIESESDDDVQLEVYYIYIYMCVCVYVHL